MTHLSFFKSIFTERRLTASGEELRYTFSSDTIAKSFELAALKIIRDKHLQLVTEIEKWESPAGVRYELVIKEVPEEMEFMADEDERYGGWWGPAAENEVWERQG